MNNTKLKWIDPLLQGLAYWIGYKKQLYPYYPLSEGAIVGESQNLISTRLTDSQKLFCEMPYVKIEPRFRMNRADLVITDNDIPSVVIEVKRHQAGIKLIEEDFFKLYGLKSENKKLKCFVLLVSQQELPKKFINKNGVAIRSTLNFNNIAVKVIRNCKSVSSFNAKSVVNSNYCCLIEVLGHSSDFN